MLGLRCRAARLRRGVSVVQGRCYSSTGSAIETPAKPVSDEEFLEALKHVYPRSRWESQKTVGLAVSGGVDSMALAQLYSRLSQKETLPNPHGIIIDHKARPGSTEEAKWVAEQLKQKLDMPSTIVPVVWPQDMDIKNLRSFETMARRLRYQALGLTCKEHNINSLLIAHHADDQVETVMMRLLKGRLRTGLQGVQAVEWIPECHGMYGIHQSGGAPIIDKSLPYPIETGGIQILRPLLGFEKERLIATCKEDDMPWAEDATNQDPTLTARNATRHVLAHHKLPAAVSKPAILSLAQKMQDRVQSHREKAEALFNTTPLKLNIQLGTLAVHFPPSTAFLDHPINTDSDINLARNTAHLYLERITQLVSPKENPPIGELHNAIDNIWPDLRVSSGESPQQPTLDFCVFGLRFRPLSDKGNLAQTSPHSPPTAQEPGNKYFFTRQTLAQQERFGPGVFFTVPAGPMEKEEAKWQLFDNRFWLRITNHTSNSLRVRTLRAEDLEILAETNAYVRRKVLGRIKPADVRLTLPAVFTLKEDGKEEFVGLPTLGVRSGPICAWDVRYRKVDFGERNVTDIVAKSEKGVVATDPKKKPVGKGRGKGKTLIEKKREWKVEDRERNLENAKKNFLQEMQEKKVQEMKGGYVKAKPPKAKFGEKNKERRIRPSVTGKDDTDKRAPIGHGDRIYGWE